MPKFYLDTEEKGKGYIVGWRGRDQQNNAKGGSSISKVSPAQMTINSITES